MPRPLVFGNGRLLVQLDNKGRIRDFFWPTVGFQNHVAGRHHHLGVFVDGRFSWTESDEWSVAQKYETDSMVGITTWTCSALGLVLEARDEVVGFGDDHDAFVRRITLLNSLDHERKVELFYSPDFRICESEIGDTAMYRADLNAMVHFKWGRYFLCSAKSDAGGIHQKTVGLRGIDGLQGTWRDAEDGYLEERTIDQGAVDSTFSVLVNCPANGSAVADFQIDCVASFPINPLPTHAPVSIAEIHVEVSALPTEVQNSCRQAARILLTQVAENGAILAANDSDIMGSNRATYSYVWPRDGALVASLLNRLRMTELATKYHTFALGLVTDYPFLLQKYNVDGSFGATWHPWVYDGTPEVPMQEDETALTLWILHQHSLEIGDHGWLKEHEKKIVAMAEFLASHIDEATGLPLPSYDLWEERRGVHTSTVASVISGLETVSKLLAAMETSTSARLEESATRMRDALLKHLVDPATDRFLRGLKSISFSQTEPDYSADASLLLVGRSAGLPTDHPAVLATNKWIEDELWVHSPIGGLARYPGDYYGRVSESYPGNPWIITTMWLAQEKIRAAKTRADMDRPLELLNWAVERGGTTGVLGEQFHPETGEVMTVSPLTWSHAEFVATCLDWCEKFRDLA